VNFAQQSSEPLYKNEDPLRKVAVMVVIPTVIAAVGLAVIRKR
jgi:hypothetical protein